MEIFTIFREHLAMCGIIVETLPRNSHPFHLFNGAVIGLANIYGISIGKLVDEAQTFEEYTDILNRTIIVDLFMISYIDIVWKTPILIRFIGNIEESIQKSKWH